MSAKVTTVSGRDPAMPAVDCRRPETVYAAHVEQVARWVSNLGGPSADVEDLTHEVFVIAFRRLETFRGDARLSTWLYRITLNVMRNHRRKARLRRFLRLDDVDVVPSDDLNPEDHARAAQRRQVVYRVLEALSDRHRTLLILFEIEGLSGAEIADLIGSNTNSVFVQLHRARRAFVREMERLGSTL